VGACIARTLAGGRNRFTIWPLAVATSVVAAALFYGHDRLQSISLIDGPKVALIQGSIDTEMKFDPEQRQQVLAQYLELTDRAVRENHDLELIIWPETMFRDPWLSADEGAVAPPESEISVDEALAQSRQNVRSLADSIGIPLLIGVDTEHLRAGGGFDIF